MKNTICIIPARGGSKGVPGKNTKLLAGIPLIHYTIEAARAIVSDEDILISTDCRKIKEVSERTGIHVPFLRPTNLATDTAGTHEVIVHSIEMMSQRGKSYHNVVLLQPTSPFRTGKHLKEAHALFGDDCGMLVSVKSPEDSPYYNQFRENKKGYLEEIMPRTGFSRQSVPPIYTYNGGIYIFKAEDVLHKHLHELRPVKKYLMSDKDSHQIDTPFDWLVAETILKEKSEFPSDMNTNGNNIK